MQYVPSMRESVDTIAHELRAALSSVWPDSTFSVTVEVGADEIPTPYTIGVDCDTGGARWAFRCRVDMKMLANPTPAAHFLAQECKRSYAAPPSPRDRVMTRYSENPENHENPWSMFLQPGEMPHDYGAREIDFSGVSLDRYFARYKDLEGNTVVERWDREGTKWVLTDRTIEAAAEQRH